MNGGGPLVPDPGEYGFGHRGPGGHEPFDGGVPPAGAEKHDHDHDDNPPPPPANEHQHDHDHSGGQQQHGDADVQHGHHDADVDQWSERANSVKTAFKHAYGAYSRLAWGYDESLPISKGKKNNFNGWGVSIIDSIDTMVLMGLNDEYNKAVEFAAALNITANSQDVHFFETVIRYLGGHLAAYHLKNDPIFLRQAEILANVLLPIFDTPSGLPGYAANTRGGRPAGRTSMYLAEVGSCQVEFKYLAHLTGDARYWKAADKVTQLMKKAQPNSAIKGLWGTNWDINNGEPSQNQFTIGALSDSAYEYLLKQYLLSGRTEKYLLDMYIKATDAMIENTLYLSPTRQMLYVTDVNVWNGGTPTPSGKLEHLSCFLPGLFALGADQLSAEELDEARRKRHRWAAEGLAYTCYAMYSENKHGLGPEDVTFKASDSRNWSKVLKEWEQTSAAKQSGAKPPGVGILAPLIKDSTKDRDYPSASQDYLLRPETIESVYLLYRTTKDQVWRERGWEMWQAVLRETRVENGFASAGNLQGGNIIHKDDQPSYFLAETLKYYYLLFYSSPNPWPLDKYVFNTEAHPLPVYQLRPWEKVKFGVGVEASK